MKPSLFTTLLALTTMTLMVMTVGSSGLRGLQSVSVENFAASVPSIKISGVSALLQILNSSSDFNNATLDVITLDSFSQSITDQGIVYEGKVTLANDQGVNVTGLINGVWDPVNNNIVLTASESEVDTEGSDTEQDSDAGDISDNSDNGDNSSNSDNNNDGNDYLTANGFTILDMEVAKNDPSIVAAFEFSAQALIEKGERQNKIPISNYAVTEWSYASYKNKHNGVYYKFVAKLLGENYVHVDTNMTTFRYNNQSLLLAGYYFYAYNISKGSLPNNFTDIENNDANTTTDNNSTEVDNGNNDTNTTNPINTTPVVPAGYTYISPEDLANNERAQAALSFGVDALIQKAISQYKVPAASPEYNVTNLILAAYKNTNTGNNFIFWTNLANALNYKVDANLTISYKASDQTYKLAGYSFRSYGYPASVIVIPQINTSNNTSNSTVVVPDNTTVIVDNSTIPDNTTVVVDNSTIPDNTTVIVDNPNDNTTVPVDNFTTVVIPPANETQPTNSTTNTTTPVNKITADGYTILSTDQLAQDSIAQAALQYGANALIQKGISQNKIPAANPSYTITNVLFTAAKKQVIGTSYKFTVHMINADYVNVDTNLTVFYRYSTKAYSLNGYSFHSYNYSSSAIVNPQKNTTNATNNNPVPENSTQPVNNSTIPDNSTQPVDNSTIPDNSTQPVDNSATNVTEPANNNTAPVNNATPQVTPDGYTILTADQLSQDSIAQAALQYGANALIQKGISQNKIQAANPSYTITNVVLAAAKKQVIGTSYKFTVNMINADYVHVDTNLTVFYRYSTKAYSLNGYAFHSSNYSSKALSNKNSSSVVLPANNITSPSNSAVVDQNNNNATVIDSGATAPIVNPTVIDALVPVAGDDSTVVDNSSPVVDNAN